MNDRSEKPARCLILIPTLFELNLIRSDLEQLAASNPGIRFETCGFGPIASAARTMQLIEQRRPQRIILMGIAGSYQGHDTVGRAFSFGKVACHGVGIGDGAQFQSAAQAGWNQWTGSADDESIGDVIQLANADEIEAHEFEQMLVTVCGASSSQQDRDCRLSIYPDAFAEDMEGFGVAMACQMASVPLNIVRGISNLVGERDMKTWKIEPALRAALERVTQWVQP